MKFGFFNRKKASLDIKKEWNKLGSKYATAVNEMVEFGEKKGWENWKGKEPEDKRDHLAVLHKLTLGKGCRDNHTIGNGNHFEEFRLILWKDEPTLMW